MSFPEDELTAITTQPFIGTPLYYQENVNTKVAVHWEELGNAEQLNFPSHHALKVFLPDDFESSTSAPETVTKTSMSLDALQQGRKWINSRMFSKVDSCQINETNVPKIMLFSEDVNIAPVMPLQAVQEMTTSWQQSPMFVPPTPSVVNRIPEVTSRGEVYQLAHFF